METLQQVAPYMMLVLFVTVSVVKHELRVRGYIR